MTYDDLLVALKTGGAALIGSVIALKGLPGTKWQRLISLCCSCGIGYLAGLAVLERYGVAPGGGYHLAAVWAGSVFGLTFVSNAQQQLPQWMDSAREFFFRRS